MKGRWAKTALNIGVAAVVFLGAFGFYFVTAPADVAWMAGAEYQRRVALTEIGEGPWDDPLFVILSRPFLLLPWGDPARQANWAAAAFAAGACLFVYLLLRMLLEMAPQFIARRVGILAALSLAVSHTFWMRAVTPGPEPLDALLLGGLLYCLIRFANKGGAMNLYLGMGLLGLSLVNNLLMLFLVPVIFIFVRLVQPPLLRDAGVVRLRGLGVFTLSASVAVAVAAWGWSKTGFTIPEEQKSWLYFWEHMTLAWGQPLRDSLLRFGSMLLLNFPPWSIFIGLIGLIELRRRQRYVFWLVFPLVLVYSFLAITFELSQPVPAYLPAWVFLSVAVGYGWWKLLSGGSWQGFAVALVLCASPAFIYRYAPLAIRAARMELRVEALLDVPKELPFDHLAFLINPDRRDLPSAREFAMKALSSIPEGATVVTPSRTSELMIAPVRYLVEVESQKAVHFVSLRVEGAAALESAVANAGSPVFVMGLHPPHPAIERILETHHFKAEGDWYRLVARSEVAARVLADSPLPGVSDDALGDSHLVGQWYGYVLPQGYPLSLDIQGTPGSLTGTALLDEEGTRPRGGRFTRLSSTLGAVLGSVELGEEGSDQLHFHVDATQKGNRLEGTWKVFEIPGLTGRFVVWLQSPST
jgi:hypothetical protein